MDEAWFLKIYVNLLMILNALAIESILFLIFNIFNNLPETWYICVCVCRTKSYCIKALIIFLRKKKKEEEILVNDQIISNPYVTFKNIIIRFKTDFYTKTPIPHNFSNQIQYEMNELNQPVDQLLSLFLSVKMHK